MVNQNAKPNMKDTKLPLSEQKHERKPISIPFVWEEKPGTPKKDWRPNPRPISANPCPPPVKFVVSVPFGWEEKPGTPLQSYTFPKRSSENEYRSFSSNGGPNGSSDSESSEACSFKTSGSFGSARVPVQQAAVDPESVGPESPGSLDERAAEGASFLEWLFPLLVPSSSFSKRDGLLEMDDKEFPDERNSSQVKRPLLTLGELIVMSRRRSCRRKVDRMREQSSMDFMRRNARGCFAFGNGKSMNGLQMKWKKQLQLI
ncbi:hydroxyproline-rich glycoprotein family protein [Striga hermonthica]|uniref:Hydroxyproline-rich glycoprotein family protein n=1 Tax=Striga hermonthica TaxID=68872 RepID=A0A9N7MPP0_STRHE|nr:hydroxyproline-rich glycoprotein family protein [Striga hermonthica]